MGMIKDWNDKDLKEAEEIKKRWQAYTEELYKKDLMTWITKALLQTKLVEVMEFQQTYFKS